MQVNGKNFKVYLSDTVDTIKDRIAVSMNTLPKYLVFNPELVSSAPTGNIQVLDVLSRLTNLDVLRFPEEAVILDKISREEAERWFIVTHKSLNEKGKDVLLRFIEGLTSLSPRSIWDDREKLKKKMRDAIGKLRDKVGAEVIIFEDFENVPHVDTAEYEVSHVQFNVKFAAAPQDTITVGELFNSVSVTKMSPYVNMGGFYKIFHDFAPSPDWLEMEAPNVVLVKVDSEVTADLRLLKDPYKKYTNAAFTIRDNHLLATMDMNVGHRNVSRDVFIDRTLEIFPTLSRNMIIQIEEQTSIGFITYPYQTLLIPVWAELVMNNNYFNKMIALNESIRASKVKQNAYVHVLNTEDTMSIAMKETEKANMYTMEDEGTYFVRVRVKSQTIADALKYQKILGRLFTLYNNEKNGVLHEYRQYIPKFLKDEEATLIRRPRKLEKLELRAIAPEIFLPTYSRKCLKRPIIVSRDQAIQYERTGEKKVMAFPLYGESTKRYYICEHETHPYPGLRENTLENKKQFPYIPCCYTKDQDREGSKYRYYFSKETMKTKQSAVQDIFVSGKILPPGLPGTLPNNLKELFSLIEPNPQYQFVRLGCNISRHSFLESVMLAVNNKNLKFVDPSARAPIVEQKRKEIVKEVYAMAAKQEFYDEQLPTIMERLAKSNLNALEFVHVLELVFDCNIFVLTSSDKDPNGSMRVPRHAQAYYKMMPTRQTVFIYQHEMGGESDDMDMQCELITQAYTDKTKTLENMNTVFAPTDTVVKGVWEVFRSLNRSFNHNNMLPSIAIPRLTVVSQVVDIYGKCRVLNIQHEASIITMVSEPLAPYAALNATTVYRASLNTIKSFANKTKTVFLKQRIKDGRVREIDATMSKGNLHVTFLTDDKGRLDGVISMDDPEEYKSLLAPTSTIVSIFSHDKKIAKLIYQYGLYMLSIFMNSRGYTTQHLDEQQLLQFIKAHTVIIPGYDYASRNLSSKYSLDSQFIKNKNAVIITSREMIIRLMYMLRLYQNTHFEELLTYKDKTHISGFYDEIADFDESPSQFILDSPDAVAGLIESYKTKTNNTVTKNVRINHHHPYFMYNPKIGTQIYLAQNTTPFFEEKPEDDSGAPQQVVIRSSMDVAVSLVRFWNKYGYNPGIEVNYVGDEPVDVYSYVNTEEITNLTKHPSVLPGLVLGYLVNGEPMYTALMAL